MDSWIWKGEPHFLTIEMYCDQGLVIAPPKTEAGNRVIALGASTLSKLIKHREKQTEIILVAGSGWKDNDLVFPSRIGTPYDPRNLLKDFKIVLARAGLPNMRIHDLRHSSITMLLNEVGAPIKEARHRAGHTRPSRPWTSMAAR